MDATEEDAATPVHPTPELDVQRWSAPGTPARAPGIASCPGDEARIDMERHTLATSAMKRARGSRRDSVRRARKAREV